MSKEIIKSHRGTDASAAPGLYRKRPMWAGTSHILRTVNTKDGFLGEIFSTCTLEGPPGSAPMHEQFASAVVRGLPITGVPPLRISPLDRIHSFTSLVEPFARGMSFGKRPRASRNPRTPLFLGLYLPAPPSCVAATPATLSPAVSGHEKCSELGDRIESH